MIGLLWKMYTTHEATMYVGTLTLHTQVSSDPMAYLDSTLRGIWFLIDSWYCLSHG